MRPCLLPILLLVATASAGTPPQKQIKATITLDVRQTARKLAHAWVDTAAPSTLDSLSHRSIAFSGMVPSLMIKVDGKRFKAETVIFDSALTVLRGNDTGADARAIRNLIYALMEIAEGRATR